MHNAEVFDRIGKLKVPVADLADGCRKQGLAVRVADRSLCPAVPFSRVAGTAVTVREYIAEGSKDYGLQIAEVYDLGRSVPCAVLVIRNEIPDFACMGSGGARVALAHGYVGGVMGGTIRDTQELPEIGFPLFGTCVRADSMAIDETPPGSSIHIDIGGPVEIAGVTVSAGDIVVADNDGMIAIAPDQIEAALTGTEEVIRIERRIFALLKQGLSYREILALEPDLSGTHRQAFAAGQQEPPATLALTCKIRRRM